MSKDIIYYIQDATKTYLFRFYQNGTLLYFALEGNAFDQKQQIIENLNENTYLVSTGQFHTDGNKISFDIELSNGNFFIYQGDILPSGDLRLTIYVMNSKKSGQLVLKSFDNTIHFNWHTTKYNINKPGLLDLRLSTFEQLQQKFGEGNVFVIDSEGIKYPEIFSQTLNTFLHTASKELPNAQLDDNQSIVFGNTSYNLNIDNPVQYISDMQIIKDFNTVLEASNSSKRFFYFNDSGDNDMNCSYFYCSKDFGLQLIAFLNAPPFYSFNDFTDRSINRNINIHFVDSSTEEKAEYFKRMFPDF